MQNEINLTALLVALAFLTTPFIIIFVIYEVLT